MTCEIKAVFKDLSRAKVFGKSHSYRSFAGWTIFADLSWPARTRAFDRVLQAALFELITDMDIQLRARHKEPESPPVSPTAPAQQQMQQQMMGPVIIIGGQKVTGEQTVEIREYGTVIFHSVPDGAEIYIDGNLIGNTPTQGLIFQAGSYQVELKKSGYNSWSRKIMVISNSTMTFKVELEQEQ